MRRSLASPPCSMKCKTVLFPVPLLLHLLYVSCIACGNWTWRYWPAINMHAHNSDTPAVTTEKLVVAEVLPNLNQHAVVYTIQFGGILWRPRWESHWNPPQACWKLGLLNPVVFAISNSTRMNSYFMLVSLPTMAIVRLWCQSLPVT